MGFYTDNQIRAVRRPVFSGLGELPLPSGPLMTTTPGIGWSPTTLAQQWASAQAAYTPNSGTSPSPFFAMFKDATERGFVPWSQDGLNAWAAWNQKSTADLLAQGQIEFAAWSNRWYFEHSDGRQGTVAAMRQMTPAQAAQLVTSWVGSGWLPASKAQQATDVFSKLLGVTVPPYAAPAAPTTAPVQVTSLGTFQESIVDDATGALLAWRNWDLFSDNTRRIRQNWQVPPGTNPTAPTNWKQLNHYTPLSSLSFDDQQAAKKAPGVFGMATYGKERAAWYDVSLVDTNKFLALPDQSPATVDAIRFGDFTKPVPGWPVTSDPPRLSETIRTLPLLRSLEAGQAPIIQYDTDPSPIPARWLVKDTTDAVLPFSTAKPAPVYLVGGQYVDAAGKSLTDAQVKASLPYTAPTGGIVAPVSAPTPIPPVTASPAGSVAVAPPPSAATGAGGAFLDLAPAGPDSPPLNVGAAPAAPATSTAGPLLWLVAAGVAAFIVARKRR